MAQGVCRLMQADLGIATTGYASAAPEYGAGIPFGHVAIWRRRANDDGSLLFEDRFELNDARPAVQEHIARAALLELRNVIRRDLAE
jgi:nicotinamide mononucleotide (NMN) deamidase PncC